jgi:Sec-independent protein translocase protein TatA
MIKTNAEKYAERNARKYLKLLNFLSLETVLDCLNRGMLGSIQTIKSYLEEIKQVREATIRMKEIDAKIEAMSPEEQEARENRLKLQRSVLYSETFEKEGDALLA